MPTISKQQPMRPAEIDLVEQVNTNTGNVATQTARITQEITDRTNADNALGNRITSETNRATAAENTLTQSLATEVSDRKAADTTLQGNIDSEVSRAKAAEQANSTAISNEVTRAKAAEEANSTAISNEVTRAKAAEETNASGISANATAISNEVTARENDVALINQTTTTLGNNLNTTNENLATETTNRETRDTQLTALINKVAGVEDASVATFEDNVKGNADAITALNGKFPIAETDLAESIQQQLTFLQTVPAMEFGTSNSVDVSANSNATVDITFGSVKTEAPVVLCGLQHESGNLACIVSGVTNQQCSIIVYNLTSTDVTGVTVDYLAISGR